ncbi:polymer-forming cytoskeletal protein [Pseudoalteromonas ruthenica]|uniref:bactofilin family protein n=1 Tax=unclassified Pseudoalteromonas TaxID=194690 RepID=UPI00034DC720|nr:MULTISPECIES: polymer-forming cytoskeletal protein [Pseudoalteromonas]MCF2863198.1 polymer-forming cytoskeletal protein [Pseudoalteromonas sp. CNAT2-18]MCG7542938.1 polymer-forming cytoskeletal protein [Pseudoalteromonas sp. MM17-2]MCG7559350.1 polymer-forming cytoskeletal protein [Pseudoalteromonas sp. CNAT2-18.1]MCG7566985.1 polymer-forming cytoskeletal protein [Pseudoalteromonas sp. CnMc7-15]MCG7571419.1 polymer-forming cytoskeletal protein [Pseudoalteromonas sp. CNC9-20]|tara:strand:+ start:14079 stop:14504 length:426 start_codon:yes stop_codon:yes gene_type:complete
MFSKNKDTQNSRPALSKNTATPSLIAADVRLTGTLSSQGEVQLDGRIDGDIKADTLIIGSQGQVEGSVEATDVTIKGRVSGSISASKVAIESSAQVQGDVFHDTLSIAAGATMEGQIKQLNKKDSFSVVSNNDVADSQVNE